MTGSTCPPRTTTSPDDIEGMAAAVGILTATGGFTSHAAVVARSMNKTCVVGCPGLTVKGDIVQLIAQATPPFVRAARFCISFVCTACTLAESKERLTSDFSVVFCPRFFLMKKRCNKIK